MTWGTHRFTKRLIIIFLAVLSLVATFSYWHFWGTVVIANDSTFYHEVGISLSRGEGYVFNGVPTMYREPGYPAFVGVVYRLFGVDPRNVQIAQAFLLFLIACGVYRLGALMLGSEKIGFVAAVITLVYPVFNLYTAWIYSEILAMFLFVASLLLFVRAESRDARYIYMISGVVYGCFVLTKTAFVVSVLLIVLAALWMWFKDNRHYALKLSLFVGGVTIVVVPWIVRNYVVFHAPSLAGRSGVVLFTRAVKVTYTQEDVMKYVVGSVLGEYTVKRFIDPAYNYEWDGQGAKYAEDMRYKMASIGQAQIDVEDARMLQAAKQLITEHPIRYVLWGFVDLHNLNSPIVWYDRHFSLFNDGSHDSTWLKVFILFIMRIVWWSAVVLSWFGIYELARNKRPAVIFVVAALAGINLGLFFLQGYPRSMMSLLPLELLCAMYGAYHVYRLRLFPRRRDRGTRVR